MSNAKYAQADDWSKWPVVKGRWYVYGLHLEGDGEIRYVGSTQNVQHRYYVHLHKSSCGCEEWVKRNRKKVRIYVFGVATKDPRGAERRMAERLTGLGHRLLNVRLPRRLTQQERIALVAEWLDRVDVTPEEAARRYSKL